MTHLRVNSSGGEIMIAYPYEGRGLAHSSCSGLDPHEGEVDVLCLLSRVGIRAYQLTGSWLLRRAGVTCLHHPTCSEYARLAFAKYSFLRALKLTWRRWRACNPFSGLAYIDWP